jgi:AraC-like DNA-binding protein
MEQTIYSNSLFAAWVILFTFGFCLIFASSPRTAEYKNYLHSRTTLGVALILFGIQIMVQWLSDFRGNAPHIATALNISCYYLEGILFGMSFISLLRPSYICRRQILSDFGKWGACMAVMWTATLALDGMVRTVVQIAAAAFFFCDATRIAIIFFRTYHQARKSMDDYYADNVKEFVAWLSRSTYGIVFFGLTGAILAFAPKGIIAIQMILGIGMFVYIFLSFINYMINHEAVEVATVEKDDGTEETKDAADDDGTAPLTKSGESLDSVIEQWIADGGFVCGGLTVDSVATLLGTNRTTLSSYINSRHTSFYEWITGLRLGKAKRLMMEHPQLTLEEVALQSGFSSKSHLSHRFKLSEDTTPGKWRKRYPVGNNKIYLYQDKTQCTK